jgi:hypothetical protein
VLDESKRRYCDDCLAEQKGEALEVASSRAQVRLAELRAGGRDPAHGGSAARKRGASNSARMREARAFEQQVGPLPDREVFRREILPLIAGVPVRRLAEATGLTRQYCGMVRRGVSVPHARHWEALLRSVTPASD